MNYDQSTSFTVFCLFGSNQSVPCHERNVLVKQYKEKKYCRIGSSLSELSTGNSRASEIWRLYADTRRKELEFTIGDWVCLKVPQMEGVMRFKKKERWPYIGP